MFQIIRRTILSLTALLVLVLTANVYFVYVIVEERSPSIQTNNEVVVGTNVTKFEVIGRSSYYVANSLPCHAQQKYRGTGKL